MFLLQFVVRFGSAVLFAVGCQSVGGRFGVLRVHRGRLAARLLREFIFEHGRLAFDPPAMQVVAVVILQHCVDRFLASKDDEAEASRLHVLVAVDDLGFDHLAEPREVLSQLH